MLYFIKDADRIRRDSEINEEAPKINVEPTIAKAELEPELHPQPQKEEEPEVKFEIAKPGIVTEEADELKEQNNVIDEFGIRAEALYDYQAGNRVNNSNYKLYSIIIFVFV